MQATKPSDREIVLTWTFAAPRQTVFDALTQANHFVHWMKATNMSLVTCGLISEPAGPSVTLPARDGKELYFTIDNKLMAVDVKATAGVFEHSAPRMLFKAPFTLEVRRNRYVAAADGQKFLIVTAGEDGAASPINIVLNWTAALKR